MIYFYGEKEEGNNSNLITSYRKPPSSTWCNLAEIEIDFRATFNPV